MIFDKSFRARQPTTKSAGSGELAVSWLDALGVRRTPKDKLGEATYFACLRTLSEAVGKLPLKLNQTLPDKGTIARPEHPLYDTLRYRPNPFITATAFWTSMEMARNHFGNCYAYIKPEREGKVTLWQMESNKVSIWKDDAKLLSNQPHIWYRYHSNGGDYVYSEEEILHMRSWISFDGILGLAVKDILELTLNGSLSSQQMLNALYDNGMAGKSVVNYTGDLNEDREKDFLAGIQNYIDGKVDSSKNLIPMPAGFQLTPLNIKLADGQFVELRKYTALQIAAAFGVKPDQINDYSKSSYSSSEAQQLAFLVDTLLWIIENYEQEITYKLLSDDERAVGYTAKFTTGVLLRTTPDKQMESLAKGVGGMIYTPNEARDHLDMCHKEHGDELYAANGSTIPLRLAGAQYLSEIREGKT